MADVERDRLAEARRGVEWKRWGPYLAERAWGTVREDYSGDGDAWDHLSHEDARSRAYRWSEDGLCGICDDRQLLCLAMALWNGRDPIVKERPYGLTNGEGRHGEDVKEHWWYLDATPTHSWMRWRYHYPQAAFPYGAILDGNAAREDPRLPEFELLDTGAFDGGRYWVITVDVAKASPSDLCLRVHVRNAGPDPEVLHVLPTLWFRNTWSWGPELPGLGPDAPPAPPRPSLHADGQVVVAEHPDLGRRVLQGDGAPELLFCENESNAVKLGWGPARTAWPKDGIVDHVRTGAPTVNPDRTGTKAALHHRLAVPGGGEAEIRLRFRDDDGAPGDLGPGFDDVLAARQAEADAFYATLTPPDATADEALVLRQAFAGMLWSKQYFHYDVARWLDGDPTSPPPPPDRARGRNHEWRHLRIADVVSMPDTWEYPWFAAWDLAFQAVVLAHVDPDLAKEQLALLCRQACQHPDGRLPAYEWDFGDVNPPVHAWAAMRVFEIDGSQDFMFLELVLDKLRRNFDWWLQREDVNGDNLFSGGFLGLDNIGPFDRSRDVPAGLVLEQSDGTAWMAMYCLNLLEMCFRLSRRYPTYEDVAIEYFEHFLDIANAMNDLGLWDGDDGFYYDILRDARDPGAPPLKLRVRSMVGLVALCAVTFLKPHTLAGMPRFEERFRWLLAHQPDRVDVVSHVERPGEGENLLFSVAGPERLRRILARVLDPDEFLSDHGVRSLSREHLDHPFHDDRLRDGGVVAYVPGESQSRTFGGNSNWRGPVWFPVNYLLIEALRRYHAYLGDGFTIEHPTGSGQAQTLDQVAGDLSRRLVGLFLRGADGRRPAHGDRPLLQEDPAWRDLLAFHEYFHGDTGAGLGAAHQTGWTGLVADLINTGGQGGASRRSPPRDGEVRGITDGPGGSVP